MSNVKLELIRGTVISKGVHGVAGEVVEVDSDTARNLRQAGAAKLAAEDATVGKPGEEAETTAKATNKK